MIQVCHKNVNFGISKETSALMSLVNTITEISADVQLKAELTTDLHVLFLTLMHKYGATEAMDMINLALDDIAEDYKISKINDLSKENKGDN